MVLKFYKCGSEKNRLEKVLEDEIEIEGVLKDSCSLITPSVLVQNDIRKYNYVWIEEFGRYYYVNNVTVVKGKMFVVDLKIDVLMSYKDEIKEMSGIVSRLTGGSEYVERNIKVDVRKDYRKIEFPNDVFTKNGSYVLIGKGGYN